MQNPRHAAIAEARRLHQRQALRCRARYAATLNLSCEDSSTRTGKAAVAHGCNSWWRPTGLRPSPAAAQTVLCRVWRRLRTSPSGRLPQRAGVWPAIVAGVAGRRSDATLWASGRCAPVSRDGGRRAQAHRPHRRSKCEGAPGRPRHHQSNQGGVRMVKPHLSPEWRGPDHACRTTRMHARIVHLRRHPAGAACPQAWACATAAQQAHQAATTRPVSSTN